MQVQDVPLMKAAVRVSPYLALLRKVGHPQYTYTLSHPFHPKGVRHPLGGLSRKVGINSPRSFAEQLDPILLVQAVAIRILYRRLVQLICVLLGRIFAQHSGGCTQGEGWRPVKAGALHLFDISEQPTPMLSSLLQGKPKLEVCVRKTASTKKDPPWTQ